MAQFPYLIPSVTSLPPGYDCVVFSCRKQLTDRISRLPVTIVRRARAFCDGDVIFSQEDKITLGTGATACAGIPPVRLSRSEDDRPAYIEVDYVSSSDEAVFNSNAVLSEYVVFSAPGKKSFFSDSAYKYASPPTIDQIAMFGAFCEGYPAVVIDRVRRYAESLIIINPYPGAIVCHLQASGERSLPRVKVSAQSAEYVDLTPLLRDDENRWEGRLQIEAKNRVVVFNVKHEWENRRIISDHEHFDPFRSDPTHLPMTRKARFLVGRYLKYRGVNVSK